jgi:phosphoenolpyruvate carboxykinase (ATP)
VPGRDLRRHGIEAGALHWNDGVAALYEGAIARGEGLVAEHGPIVCRTGVHTGRSPNDKFIVRSGEAASRVWWGKVNRALDARQAADLLRDVRAHLGGRELFVQDLAAGADPAYRLSVRVITERAWHSLFARHLFIVDPDRDRAPVEPGFSVIAAPSFTTDPARHGTVSGVAIVIDFEQRVVVIAGTAYAGEIKKSIFTVMNYLLPAQGVLSMHCSANVGAEGAVALFFGLSGTGKTTLSSDPERRLIGDDEHGWSDRGVFNLEGGCYAKLIRLSAEAEPQIFATTRRFATVLENVTVDPVTRRLDLDGARCPKAWVATHATS